MQHYTQNDKFVFFNAVDAQVQLTVDDTVVGAADTVDALVELLLHTTQAKLLTAVLCLTV